MEIATCLQIILYLLVAGVCLCLVALLLAIILFVKLPKE